VGRNAPDRVGSVCFLVAYPDHFLTLFQIGPDEALRVFVGEILNAEFIPHDDWSLSRVLSLLAKRIGAKSTGECRCAAALAGESSAL
jgi:hypothetical protein